MEMFNSQLFHTVVTGHRCLVNTYTVASVTKKMNFKFYLIFTYLNSHMQLVATTVE